MAISVNWVTGVVSVPKADTTLTGTDPISGREIRSFDTDQFHVNLRIAEDSLEGRSWPVTHDYNADETFGGTTYAPQFKLKNSYTVEFEDGTYRVIFTSTNNNIADFSVVNNVSIQPGNSAGLQLVPTGTGLSAGQDEKITQTHSQLHNIEGMNDFSGMFRAQWAITCGLAKDYDTGGPITEDTTRITYKSMDGTKDRVIFDVVNLYGTRDGVTLDMS